MIKRNREKFINQKLHYSIVLRLILIISIVISSVSLYAQQPISGNYAAGAFTGMKGAVTPPHGNFMIENGTLHYNTRDFVDSDGNSRETATVNALANRTILGYVFDWQILGGNYFAAVIVPFANVALRPQPGSEKAFQMGDLILQPLALGWDNGVMHYQFAYNLWLPTARFNAGASNNVGKGLYSHLSFRHINPQIKNLQYLCLYYILGKLRRTF
jgi:hypothetical protein